MKKYGRAEKFVRIAERHSANGSRTQEERLNWVIAQAERVNKLSDSAIDKTRRELALYRIWALYGVIQEAELNNCEINSL